MEFSWLYIFDIFGTLAFAISGAIMGVKKNMDIYGMFILALATGVAGGSLRDIILGRLPLFILVDINYAITIAIATLIVFFSYNSFIKSNMKLILNLADAVGLGVFTCIGASIAMQYQESWHYGVLGILFCGVMTATFGGMVRDMLAGEIPMVLQKEIYASASLLGCIIFLILNYFAISLDLNIFITSSIIILIRVLAIFKNWNLPTIKAG